MFNKIKERLGHYTTKNTKKNYKKIHKKLQKKKNTKKKTAEGYRKYIIICIFVVFCSFSHLINL